MGRREKHQTITLMKKNSSKQSGSARGGMPRRILVPVDFSDPSRKGVAAAVALARRSGAELTLAYVAHRRRPDSRAVLELLNMSSSDRAARLQELEVFAERNVPGEIKSETVMLDGVPYDEISRAASRRSSDLIVIATHGYTGLRHEVMGSTTERVVRHAPCSVLAVRGWEARGTKAFAPGSLRTLLLTTDFSENSLAAFPTAAAWARELGARIELLYVVPQQLPGEMSQLGLVFHEKKAAREAEKNLPEIRRRHLPADLEVKTRVVIGSSDYSICKVAHDVGAGLIVLASHGHTGFKRLLLGSVAERVVQRARCAVLVVRGKGRS